MLLLILAFFINAPTTAQENGDNTVTFDEVNKIAAKMYCPICENEPLDVCGVPTCVEWRQEIRSQLEDGRTEAEIIDYFVTNYGDRVVGIPEDETLRTYTFAGPLIMSILALLVGVWTFIRWRARQEPETINTAQHAADADDDDYRSRLESDLQY